MVQFSMKDEYNRGVREERARIIALIESLDASEESWDGYDLIRKINDES